MPRKTDSKYPGFDLEEPDWPTPRRQLLQVSDLAQTVKGKLSGN